MVYSKTDMSLKLFNVDVANTAITEIADVYDTVDGFYTADQI